MGKDKKKPKKESKLEKPIPKVDNVNRNPNRDVQDGEAAAINGKGCICPIGCLVGKEITINDVLGVRVGNGAGDGKYVKVFCSNAESGKCQLVPFMHDACFNRWEDILIRQLRMRNSTRDWNDDKVKRHLWMADGGTFVHKSRKCTCGGFVTRVDPEDEELPKPTEKAQKKAVKAATDPESSNKKKLPPLVTGMSKGTGSVYKTCPGYSGRDIAASYASNDYTNRMNRNRVRTEREEFEEREEQKRGVWEPAPEWQQKQPQAGKTSKSLRKNAEVKKESGFVGLGRLLRNPGQQSASRTTSLSSSADDYFWAMSGPPFASPVPKQTDWFGSETSGLSGRKTADLQLDDDDDEEEDDFITEEELTGELRDLLRSLGGQLDLDDPLLTGIVGRRSSNDLMMAICDAGGLGQWLSNRPEFDVDNGRVRLCRNIKREPARLSTTGTVYSKSDLCGTIYCASYDCSVYFDEDVSGFDGFRKGDIVKVEAVECRPPADGHRWKATLVSLLQRENQPFTTAMRRSYEAQESKPAAKKEEPKATSELNRWSPPLLNIRRGGRIFDNISMESADLHPGLSNGFEFSQHNYFREIAETSNGQLEEFQNLQGIISGHEIEKGETSAPKKEIGQKEPESVDENFDAMLRKLTTDYLPTAGGGYGGSAYGDVLAMVKAWDVHGDV